MKTLIDNILHHYSLLELYTLSFSYFLFLYFIIGPLFLLICKFLATQNILHQIDSREVNSRQIKFEILHSFQSIIIFGFSLAPIVYLVRIHQITLLPDTWFNVIIGVIILTFWNEVHFFTVHRIMHLKFFMKHVHYIHHRSKTPTVYSVYSFHWLEAFLLSTIPITIIPFIPFSIVAVFIYPLASVLLNYAGHCNYRFGNGEGNSWKLFATNHNQHHSKGKRNYGFALNFLDKLFSNTNH